MRRILVVDDDPHVGRAIQGWLRDHGFHVQLADSIAAGLIALDHFRVDLMIVDVLVPDISGFESIRLFHARGAGGAADCNLRFCRSESCGSGLDRSAQARRAAWREAMPAQAVQAGDAA